VGNKKNNTAHIGGLIECEGSTVKGLTIEKYKQMIGKKAHRQTT